MVDEGPRCFYDSLVWNTVYGIITDGTDKLDRHTGFLRLEPCVDVDADVGFGEVLAV